MNNREHQEAVVDYGFFQSHYLEAVEPDQRVRISRKDIYQNQIAIVNSWDGLAKEWVVSLVNPDLLVDAPAGEILVKSEDLVLLGSREELTRLFPSQISTIEATDCVICLEKLNLNLKTVAPGDMLDLAANPICEHVFHHSCLAMYQVQSSIQQTVEGARRPFCCPICRRKQTL
jgi:hypothetical protein